MKDQARQLVHDAGKRMWDVWEVLGGRDLSKEEFDQAVTELDIIRDKVKTARVIEFP